MAVVGMGFNVLLIYLALFQSPRAIRSYATLIVNFAITDFFACFFDMFVQQRIIPAGVSLGYMSTGFCKYFGPTPCYVGYSLLLHSLSHSLWSLFLSFSYRYYILYYPAPSRKTLTGVVFLIYLPSLLQWVSFLWAQDDPKEIVEILHEMYPDYNLTGYCVTGTKNIVSFYALYTIFYMTLPITPVYVCILILRKKIIARLSFQGVSITKDTKNMHSQLLMALTYQAILPGFYLLSAVSYGIGQLGIYNHAALEYFTFSCILFIPFLSPLASFIFVSPYRRFISRKIFRTPSVEPTETSITFNRYNSNNQPVG